MILCFSTREYKSSDEKYTYFVLEIFSRWWVTLHSECYLFLLA